MDMVRAGVMFSFREASCWRVEVVKGGAGLRCLSWRFTLATDQGAFFTAWTTASASSLLFRSIFFSRPWNMAWKPPRLGDTRLRSA